MKIKLVSRIFFTSICLCAFASLIVAQEKPRIVEFAKVNVNPKETEIDKLTATLEKFLSRLDKEPETTDGYIDVPTNIELGRKLQLFMANDALKNRVKFWGEMKQPELYRIDFGVNFYLIPQGAQIPYERVNEPCICPVIDVVAPENVVKGNSVLAFTAELEGENQKEIKYKWFLSAGRIIEGQGTKTIKVDAEDAKEVTATVRFSGSCDDEICPLTISGITKIQQ